MYEVDGVDGQPEELPEVEKGGEKDENGCQGVDGEEKEHQAGDSDVDMDQFDGVDDEQAEEPPQTDDEEGEEKSSRNEEKGDDEEDEGMEDLQDLGEDEHNTDQQKDLEKNHQIKGKRVSERSPRKMTEIDGEGEEEEEVLGHLMDWEGEGKKGKEG